MLLEHVERLDLTVSMTGSCLSPAQSITFIGMALSSRTMSATLSHAWAGKILQLFVFFNIFVGLDTERCSSEYGVSH